MVVKTINRPSASESETLAVIDFETTGMSPAEGARPTEIAVVLVRDGQLVDRYQSLMNAGLRVPSFIEELTGISTALVRAAPAADKVMAQAFAFVGDHPLVAHNASFDSKFWDAELGRMGKNRPQEFVCSMLLSRRVFPNAANHKLGTLVQSLRLPATGRYHRALADAEATAYLLLRIQEELSQRYRWSGIRHEHLVRLQRVTRAKLDTWAASQTNAGLEHRLQ